MEWRGCHRVWIERVAPLNRQRLRARSAVALAMAPKTLKTWAQPDIGPSAPAEVVLRGFFFEEAHRHRTVRVRGPENVCSIMEDEPCVEFDVYISVVMRAPFQTHGHM